LGQRPQSRAQDLAWSPVSLPFLDPLQSVGETPYLTVQRAHFISQPLHRRIQALDYGEEHRPIGPIIGPLGARISKLGEDPRLLLRQKIESGLSHVVAP
jgi:hypothetical protein